VFTYYLLKNEPGLDHLAYLDSDIYFYSSPQPIFDELGSDSILIIRHNYAPALKYLEKKGIYNVALVLFKNDARGLACLEWWQGECLKWCYNKHEDGKFGDQLYLNAWPEKFAGVYVLKNEAANVAPWNLDHYEITAKDSKIMVNGHPLIFYHFHTFKILGMDKFQRHSSFYRLNPAAAELIYPSYETELKEIISEIKAREPRFNYGFREPENFGERLKQKLKRIYAAAQNQSQKFRSR